MSDLERQRVLLLEKRARALALMLLTRREELLIEEGKDALGLDYLVRFRSKRKEGLREFGILVRGALAAGTKEHADQALRPALRETERSGPSLRPVCLFLFAMEEDRGWYTWVAEPIETEGAGAQLRYPDKPDCRSLDRRALREILQRVDGWYDVLYPSLLVNGPSRARPERSQTAP